ncbi:MAG: hypothetical protein JO286_01580, partial [Solirubrobacterales bacterium]|nr:hypothetical protein [Solirubrobacterales bacterium]
MMFTNGSEAELKFWSAEPSGRLRLDGEVGGTVEGGGVNVSDPVATADVGAGGAAGTGAAVTGKFGEVLGEMGADTAAGTAALVCGAVTQRPRHTAPRSPRTWAGVAVPSVPVVSVVEV